MMKKISPAPVAAGNGADDALDCVLRRNIYTFDSPQGKTVREYFLWVAPDGAEYAYDEAPADRRTLAVTVLEWPDGVRVEEAMTFKRRNQSIYSGVVPEHGVTLVPIAPGLGWQGLGDFDDYVIWRRLPAEGVQ